MIQINIDIDNEGKLALAMQGHQIPSWVYANSQTEHENKRVRLARIQREAVQQRDKQEEKTRQRVQRSEQHQKKEQEVNKARQAYYHDKSDDLAL